MQRSGSRLQLRKGRSLLGRPTSLLPSRPLRFLLCFGATASGTILHYGFGMEAPYGLLSLPKLLGVPGGLLLTAGTIGLAYLKTKADPTLGAARVWGGEMAFIGLLGFVAVSGLALYAATGTVVVAPLLALHLGSVLALFLLLPFTRWCTASSAWLLWWPRKASGGISRPPTPAQSYPALLQQKGARQS